MLKKKKGGNNPKVAYKTLNLNLLWTKLQPSVTSKTLK